MGSGFALFVAERRAKVLRLNPPTHESARLRFHGVGHREIAHREDSRKFGRFCAHDVCLWVRMRGQIARTRADFAQFSEIPDNRETGWWMVQSTANRSLRWLTPMRRLTMRQLAEYRTTFHYLNEPASQFRRVVAIQPGNSGRHSV